MLSLPISFVHNDSGSDNVVPDMIRRAEKKKEDMETIKDLESIQTLCREIKAFEDKNISKLIASQQLVHYIDDNLTMATSKDRYFLMNPSVIRYLLVNLVNLEKIKLSLPLPIRDMLELVSQDEDERRDMVKTIVLHRGILNAYFKFPVDCDDELNCLYVLAREFGLFYCSCSKGQCELVLKAIRQNFPNLDMN
ncbi:hypothetical protein G6F68_006442 [Rhizopus microsporus]|nr:hypothetical protein G6F67_006888 [Rhizopus microsporus]KAG1261768.1 hypothetical protein G6F68_006442 [Rhizopus microsporus]